MAFLMSAVNLLADMVTKISDPGGLWEWLILKVFVFIRNYGWEIVFFTVCLKLLLLPLDIFQRIKMRKNQMITERIKPQMEKLQQQYAGDKQTLSQKQMELNKKEGFSYFSSCLPMIITLVIFFYLFSGLNNISQYKQLKQYVELYDAYTAVETELRDAPYSDVPDIDNLPQTEDGKTTWNYLYDEWAKLDAIKPAEESYKNEEGAWGGALGGEEEYTAAMAAWNSQRRPYSNAMTWIDQNMIQPVAQDAVVKRYDEIKESFLWVANIWSPDVPWRKAILTSEQFTANINKYGKYKDAAKKLKIDTKELTQSEYEDMISTERYNVVTAKLQNSAHNRVNGYLVLPILSVGLSFLSQFLTSRLQKKSGQAAPEGGMAGSMKMMMVIMPLMMGMFALSYTAMFTLYIVVNSAMTILINVFTSLIMDGKSKKKEKELTTGVQKYGRPDPNDL